MKKLVNLIALVMLVSTNVLTPFSYAGVEIPELIPENEVGNVEGIGETREKDNEITGEIPNSLGEVEGERSLPLVREEVNESEPEGLKEDVEDSIDDVESPTTGETEEEDSENKEEAKPVEEIPEGGDVEEGNIGEGKENANEETGDLLLKSLVNPELYAVNDPLECGSGYVLNDEGTECELIQVTFDANGGSFDGGEDTKTVDTIVTEVLPTRYSHTANINDDGVATSVYANNLSTNDVVTIPGATSLDIEVRFATESASYDWLAIYPAGITPTAGNYSSASISNGKLAGHGSYSSYTKPSDNDTAYHKIFTVDGDTAQFYFKSDSSSAYYGYYAIISGVDAGNSYVCSYDITVPTREGYIFDGWYVDTGYTQIFNTSESECLSSNTMVYAKWYQPQPKDIILEATATSAKQTLKINKYFANAYKVYRGDGEFENLISDTTHTYASAGTYTITLTPSTSRWTFQNVYKPLVPTSGTTVADVKIVSMPSLADGFGNSETNPGNYFFNYFNYNGQLTSLPEGSFDTSKITTAGYYFFSSFNSYGSLTSLPEGSFDTSKITTVGHYFFSFFNSKGALTSLPEGSFNTSNIRTVGIEFFNNFNNGGALVSLPIGSFRLSTGLTIAKDYFFQGFNSNGQLTSLPEGSFDTSKITTVGKDFFGSFNHFGSLTNLPEGSFNTSKITATKDYFFQHFNSYGSLTSLPEGSFDISKITTVGHYFFQYFNYNGQLTSLPEGSFNTSNIRTVGYKFFDYFNSNGQLTSLPEGSFDTSKITTAGYYFFSSFNDSGSLTSLPEGSFDTSNIIGESSYFFYSFNKNGALTNLPIGSFRFSTGLTIVRDMFFYAFNNGGSLTSLPEGSFDMSNINTVGNSFFSYFNSGGSLTSLPEGSFDMSNINTVENSFFSYFNYKGKITNLPDSFKLSSVGGSKDGGYGNIFNSPSYTLNRNVSDIVSGVTAPKNDKNTFSDNQPGRCGVNPNWLVNPTNACNILYDANGGTGTVTGGYMSNITVVTAGRGITLPTREGCTFSGWQDASGNNIDQIIFPDMDGQTLYANWTPNEYSITFEDSSEENEKIVISGLYLSETSSIKYPKWAKEGYKIVWDKEIPATMPAENMIIKASWEKNGYSGGGGGGGSSKKTDEDTHGSAEDSQKNTQDDKNTENVIQSDPEHSEWGSEESSNTPVDSSDKSSEGQEILSPSDSPSSAGQVSFTKEQKDAYTFAKENGITTKDTIQSAQMNGKLTRIAMAKMLSQYAINVLGQTPDTSKTIKFRDVTSKKDADYDNGVTLAYQLGIMGQNMPNNRFRPNDEVSRAEFVTALSRLLYQTTDGEYKSTKEYYIPHMAKLYNEGIINNTDSSMKERRGYVMIMLMRSAK